MTKKKTAKKKPEKKVRPDVEVVQRIMGCSFEKAIVARRGTFTMAEMTDEFTEANIKRRLKDCGYQ